MVSQTSAIATKTAPSTAICISAWRSAVLDEVRQDRSEEHDDLRVGDSDDESVAEQFGRTQRPRRAAEHCSGGGPALAEIIRMPRYTR